MDKRDLLGQLESHLREIAHTAHSASASAAQEAKHGATSKEKRADARKSIEYAGLARGQDQRARRAFAELSALEGFHPRQTPPNGRVQIGCVVEIEDLETGEGRTFFLAPAGAGTTLTGPGGDGLLSVVTPQSPIGRTVMGKCRGDIVDVAIAGNDREWRISWVE